MDCTHCGRISGIESFTMLFSPESRKASEIELRLCHLCADDLLSDADVALVKPDIFVP